MAKKKTEAKEPAPQRGRKGSGTDRELNHGLLRSMLLQRRFEERTAEAYALGKIGGFCHLYIGQEAVGTGALSALREDDYIDQVLWTITADHWHALRPSKVKVH